MADSFDIERGELTCNVSTLNLIADALNVPTSSLSLLGTESRVRGTKDKVLNTVKKSVLGVVEAE